MFSGASMYGIDLSLVDTPLLGVRIDGDSDVSTPAEGWLWKDSQNGLWVQSRFGRLRLHRNNWGGWETMRIWQGPNAAGGIWGSDATKPIGARGYIDCSNDTKPTSSAFFVSVGGGADTATFVLLDTGLSSSPCRLLGRGATLGASRTTIRLGSPDLLQTAGTSTEPNISDWPAGTIASYRGVVARQVLGGTGFGLVWYYGASVQEQ
jgi:hypothetical protein